MPRHRTITGAAAGRFAVKSGRADHFDSSYPGLALRVSAGGRRVWVYFFRLKNGKAKLRRMTLGVYPAMGVEQAHAAWRLAFDLVQAGRDPTDGSAAVPPASFEGVFFEWLRRDQSRHRAAAQVEQRLRGHVLPVWKDRLITDIDRRAALAVIDDIADRGTVVLARRIYAHLHRLFVWCVGRGILEVNPLLYAPKPGSETPRERVLSDPELKKIWVAAGELTAPFRDALRILILTGARREEISRLRWDEIVDGAIHLEGERTKNGKPHIIPLSSPATMIIAGIQRGGEFVFSLSGKKPVGGWSREKARLDKGSHVTDWRTHDIRRTMATGLQRLGVPLPVTEGVLGHVGGSRGGIVGVYQRHTYLADKVSALEAWGAHVTALVEGREPGKVVAFGTR